MTGEEGSEYLSLFRSSRPQVSGKQVKVENIFMSRNNQINLNKIKHFHVAKQSKRSKQNETVPTILAKHHHIIINYHKIINT